MIYCNMLHAVSSVAKLINLKAIHNTSCKRRCCCAAVSSVAKLINLKAIHNKFLFLVVSVVAVSSVSKLQIWERFTTGLDKKVHDLTLFSVCQSYKFESDSQPAEKKGESWKVVFSVSKLQIWERFTTYDVFIDEPGMLFSVCQSYKFESDSQHIITCVFYPYCCFQCVKVTNLRAIHNSFQGVFDWLHIYLWNWKRCINNHEKEYIFLQSLQNNIMPDQ